MRSVTKIFYNWILFDCCFPTFTVLCVGEISASVLYGMLYGGFIVQSEEWTNPGMTLSMCFGWFWLTSGLSHGQVTTRWIMCMSCASCSPLV